ncbi:RNA-directed DNA polymerase (reverse transcriptase)-related family protein [Rhynchospora pubera]|uniref:RNA-directed DNA polymerase (Reverse transcriptase)-related family protein n=1 Tax=Rhynchospora pubera TaxID=906938 RepID=A0AAV8G575_9POAL|nr:RNA-directed DNA polymerase (reverse transcriptase)-related family protein [Rhynchospora pubera]
MTVFKLPTWVVKAIDKLRRNFLWGRSTGTGTGIPLLAWDRVCLPKQLGGMGVLNLKLLNTSLLLKWLWRLFDQPNSQWAILTKSLFTSRTNVSPLSWTARGSFFWRDLMTFRHLFSISTTFNLGDGKDALFWFSDWGSGYLRFFDSKPPPYKSNLTVFQVLQQLPSSLQAPWNVDVHNAILYLSTRTASNTWDICSWKWNSSGCFTVKSAYNTLVSTGKTKFLGTSIWKVKIPPSIQIFTFLVFHNRLLTQDALVKRNIFVQPGCSLCSSTSLETANHIFCSCPYTLDLWSRVHSLYPSILYQNHTDCKQLITEALHNVNINKKDPKAVLTITVLWALWLERNNRIFRGAARNTVALLHWVNSQQEMFLKHC